MAEQVGIIEALLGFTERDEANPDAARAHFYRALSIAEEQRRERVLAMALNGLGSLAADEGDFAEARQAKERSLAMIRSLGDHWVVALITGSLGRICSLAGDQASARKFLREFLIIARDLGNKWTMPYAVEALADICAQEKQSAKAVQLYAAALTQRKRLALPFSGRELAAHQAALASLHQQLPDEVFDHEWNTGSSLELQAAVELV
jgi:tetratricopeptide (TPR) repeat protein